MLFFIFVSLQRPLLAAELPERACANSALLATELTSPYEELKSSGIIISKKTKIEFAYRVKNNCSAPILSVFSGGVILAGGQSYEITPTGFNDVGKGRSSPGDKCPSQTKLLKCIKIGNNSRNYIALVTSKSGNSIRFFNKTKSTLIVNTEMQAKLLDFNYRYNIHGYGGTLVTYASIKDEGYLLFLLPNYK